MGTRSTIALEFADGTVQQVYCHWDGYLEHNGEMLDLHYRDPFMVRSLIDLGDFSTLHPTVDATAGGAYSRQGSDSQANCYKDIFEYERECQQEEYDYILVQESGSAVWRVRCYATQDNWVKLSEAKLLIKQMNEEGVY